MQCKKAKKDGLQNPSSCANKSFREQLVRVYAYLSWTLLTKAQMPTSAVFKSCGNNSIITRAELPEDHLALFTEFLHNAYPQPHAMIALAATAVPAQISGAHLGLGFDWSCGHQPVPLSASCLASTAR